MFAPGEVLKSAVASMLCCSCAFIQVSYELVPRAEGARYEWRPRSMSDGAYAPLLGTQPENYLTFEGEGSASPVCVWTGARRRFPSARTLFP